MKRLIILVVLSLSWIALTHEIYAQSCNIPSTCQVARSCPHVIAPFPCWDGSGPLFGISQEQDDLIYNSITVDDNGTIGTGDCNGGSGCWSELIFKNPDPITYQVKGLWWRMHDHEEGASYRLSVCRTPMDGNECSNWQEVQTADVHTSGEDCEEQCSTNNDNPHPPGDQGCPDPLPNPAQCQSASDRQNWSCALSFDEHTWQTNACTPETITGVRVNFEGDNEHVHLADLLWMLDGPSCTIQGSKLPDQAPFNGMKVTITDQQSGSVVTDSVAQPFLFENLLANRTYTVSVERPSTFSSPIASTACVNATDCHANTTSSNPAYQVGETRTVSCPATGGFVDLRWHFAETPTVTPTVIPQMCRQDISLTLPAAPTPSNMRLRFKVKFQGVLLSQVANESWKTQPVKVTLIKQIASAANIGAQTIFSKSFDNIPVHATGEVDANGIAIWQGELAASGVMPGEHFSILVKGPKHLQRKFCENNPPDRVEEGFPYRCLGAGNITLSGGDNVLDFSQVSLQAGDLPGGTAGRQDGIVNAYDISLVLNMIRDGQSEHADDVRIADMDLNGVVNAKDRGYLIETLEEKYGDEE